MQPTVKSPWEATLVCNCMPMRPISGATPLVCVEPSQPRPSLARSPAAPTRSHHGRKRAGTVVIFMGRLPYPRACLNVPERARFIRIATCRENNKFTAFSFVLLPSNRHSTTRIRVIFEFGTPIMSYMPTN
jgi:hypothetical protein